MNDEFDYELTLDQWEALKALRAPAANPSRLRRSAVESLIALGLVALREEFDRHYPSGTQGPDSRLVAIVAGHRGVIRLSTGGARDQRSTEETGARD